MREIDYLTQLNQTEEQQEYLRHISMSRGYETNDILNAYRAIFIPSVKYMLDNLGHLSIADKLYLNSGHSFVPGKLFIPGFSPLGHLITFLSYDAIARFEAKETGLYGVPYYFYPEDKGGFRKSNFLLMPYEQWEQALTTGKIGIADGVFDAGSVSVNLAPCASNVGTSLGLGVRRILNMFDEVTLYKDNDDAGTQLYLQLIKYHPNINLVKIQAGEKDIDGYLAANGSAELRKSIELFGRPKL